MQIAVVIPAYDAGATIGRAVSSVLSQSHSSLSLIVVDDGSSDDTAAVAGRFNDPRLRIAQQPNAGVSAARNRGLALTRGAEAVLFLDADDWLAPTALEVLAATLAASPWAVAAAGRYARVGADGSQRVAAVPAEGSILEQLLTRNLFANGGHVLIAADALSAAGAFRCDLDYGEDWEFWTRLALLGEFVVSRDRRPVLYVRDHAGSASYRRATEPDAYAVALRAIYGNPDIRTHVGARRLAELRRLADAETAWAVGRALAGVGDWRAGTGWLLRSVAVRPTPKRLCLLALSALRLNTIPLFHADGRRWRSFTVADSGSHVRGPIITLP